MNFTFNDMIFIQPNKNISEKKYEERINVYKLLNICLIEIFLQLNLIGWFDFKAGITLFAQLRTT